MANVFTYGSLMFDSVWTRVVRGQYRSTPARLTDHARVRVRNQTYPGVYASPGAAVEGVLYFDVQAADLQRLDAFEGNEYARVSVQAQPVQAVEAQAGAPPASVEAQLYLYLDRAQLEDAPWDPQWFATEGIKQFAVSFLADRAPD